MRLALPTGHRWRLGPVQGGGSGSPRGTGVLAPLAPGTHLAPAPDPMTHDDSGGRFAHNTFTTGSFPWEPPCSDSECQLNIGHDHNDTNTFYLYRAGQPLAPETMGVGNYDTSFHNSILIDGQEQYRPDDDNFGRFPEDFIGSDGFLEATAHTGNYSYVAADATRRYRQIDEMEDVTRHVLFVRPDYLIMLDNLAANKAHDYTWISHFGENVSVQGNWVRGDAAEGETLGIRVAAPEAFKTTTGDDGQPFVRLKPAKPAADVRFITLLYPTTAAAWGTRPEVPNLADTGSAAWLRVRHDQGQIDDVWVSYGQAETTNSAGPYRSDGQVAVISRDGAGDLNKLFLHGGTVLTDENRGIDLVKDLASAGTVEAVFSQQAVVVRGSVGGEISLYAPQTQALIYNGLPWLFTQNGDHIRFEVKQLYLPVVFKL